MCPLKCLQPLEVHLQQLVVLQINGQEELDVLKLSRKRSSCNSAKCNFNVQV